jgi:hypothetical protein
MVLNNTLPQENIMQTVTWKRREQQARTLEKALARSHDPRRTELLLAQLRRLTNATLQVK